MQSMGNTTMFRQDIEASQKCALSYHVYNTCCSNKNNLLR